VTLCAGYRTLISFVRRLGLTLILVSLLSPATGRAQLVAVNLDTALGVVTLSDSRLTDSLLRQDSIRFYNPDGTVWYLFSFYYDDSDGRWAFPNSGFNPYAFSPDYFVLVLCVTRRNAQGYEVVVNTETGLRKWLPAAPYLQFQTWQQHLLTGFAVDFDSTSNPLRAAPNDRANLVLGPGQHEVNWPLLVKGDWLKVGWGGERPGHQSGWIRWRRGNLLVAGLFYLD